MKIVEIRQDAEFQRLRPAWENLLSESVSPTIFLTWEWLWAWWHSYGDPEDLRILAAFDDGDVLRGVAPLQRKTVRRYRQAAAVQSFIGDGSADSDYLDFIIARGYEAQVMDCFWSHLREDLDRGVVLLLNEIPASSRSLPLLEAAASRCGMLFTRAEAPCATVALPDGWDEYLSLLKPRFRTKVRSVLRHLEGRPSEVRFSFCEHPGELEWTLPALFDLHAKRWHEEGKPGVFGGNEKRDFYFTLSRLLLERGWLRFSRLEWSGRILACQYGFIHGNTYFHLQEGYAPETEHWNVGMGLRAWTIREFMRAGVREYDFLGGASRHKSDWGATVKTSHQLQIAKRSYKNILFCRGPKWETRARGLAAEVLPAVILEARRSRLRRQSLAAIQSGSAGNPGSESPAGGRFLRAAASGYIRSGAPALIRGLRERYELSVSKGGGWPRLSLRRRAEPAARILYYHRVNDAADPFFPATPTRVFEQQMRFVSSHHKVVSLTELLDRLENGTPGTSVAITFDDGYRDNHDNALPVLRRYGLPATVFLTTGSIDGRQPMWFDQMAGALKATALEFLDLEIGLPQRFWLRTEAERLVSVNRLFGLLRSLPDEDRRGRVPVILRQLGGNDGIAESGMLTWDQVREMKAQGIDFGGHTVTHPFLSKLSIEQAGWEVSECKRRIEEELQVLVKHFAYPNGREEDIGEQSREVIRRAGYEAAVTTIWGVNYRSTDVMALKRGQPWEADPAVFACKLDWYQFVNG
jgi:CelD/BcsL family acetyltransferase involved in cellulose biosynthesis/peptidoglycan/xylan/chitin deacetylase (PgdA/CDA1 family)